MESEQVCRRCLYRSDHPLGLIIDEEGVCSGCRYHEEKDALDWDARWSDLTQLVKPFRSRNPSNYDCVIPVSGAQDSYYIVHQVKNVLGMKPLLVTYNKYWNTPLGIWNLSNLRRKFNCDILIQNVNPHSVRRVCKTTLRMLGSIYWHCIAGQTVFPVQVAVQKKYRLLSGGAHQGNEQVGMFSHLHNVEMTRRYRKDHDLMGFEADDLVTDFDLLNERDVWQYRYPEDTELNEVGVRGIYLSNFVRWDPKAQHEEMIDKFGFKTARFNRTFDCYDFVDCYNYMGLHDEIKQVKHGYSKVTDHATREIRHGRLEKKTAESVVSFYSSQPARFTSLFCDWLGIDERSMRFVLNQHAQNVTAPDSWATNMDESPVDIAKQLEFVESSNLSAGEADRYITIGKGWP